MKEPKKMKRFIITFIALVTLFVFFPTYTPKIKTDSYKVEENSIAELSVVELGNVEQSIMIRGKNTDNPVVLFLHGGPGYPFTSYARKFQSRLEESFVVVNWDQRGSGKSYSKDIDASTMTQDQLESDTLELVDYLCSRFGEDNIYIVGHSWGTVLGIETVKSVPEKIAAYIGIGQVIDDVDGERISYEYVVKRATAENNQKAFEELKSIGVPPYKTPETDTFIQRKWLKEYGGFETEVITLHEILKGIAFAPEYSGLDGIKFLQGNTFSINTLFNNREKADFREKYTEFDVPMYFCAGRYDYNTPSELVEQYFKSIKAPVKNFYWFEKSAHEPHLVEEDKFYNIMMEIYKETNSIQSNQENLLNGGV